MSCLEGWGWPAHYLQAGAGCNGQTDRLKVIVTIKLHLTSRDIEKSTLSFILCACARARDAGIRVNGLFVLSGSNANSLPLSVVSSGPAHILAMRPQRACTCLKERRGNIWARSVALNVSGNSHKEAMSGDKMFYFQPQILASKWQDCRACLNLTPDL